MRLTVAEAAKRLKCGERTIWNRMKAGRLPFEQEEVSTLFTGKLRRWVIFPDPPAPKVVEWLFRISIGASRTFRTDGTSTRSRRTAATRRSRIRQGVYRRGSDRFQRQRLQQLELEVPQHRAGQSAGTDAGEEKREVRSRH